MIRDFKPLSFFLHVDGDLNNQKIEINGLGYVAKPGEYRGALNFNKSIPDFHPSAVVTFLMSICCYAEPQGQNGAYGIRRMGGVGYDTKRTIEFEKDEKIEITGSVKLIDNQMTFTGYLQGQFTQGKDLSGNSIYIKKITPNEDGHILKGVGEGSLFRNHGNELKAKITTEHVITPNKLENPINFNMFRIVSESGYLIGNTYSTQVHSILDKQNTMSKVWEMH